MTDTAATTHNTTQLRHPDDELTVTAIRRSLYAGGGDRRSPWGWFAMRGATGAYFEAPAAATEHVLFTLADEALEGGRRHVSATYTPTTTKESRNIMRRVLTAILGAALAAVVLTIAAVLVGAAASAAGDAADGSTARR